ncbi:hypothetical protein C9374_005206 [Naegleria lovaniensis]|uniref:Calcineurin-like phosphoesterase domain-containing protein n=1 Tax=Naegleria lovaniensis TaxID=51637 RepID=A0AA88KNJ2_NAELO|nr:uncharacterized protein C9374_005206 [Naegleria lovaniensis]KAG2382626.1 hypothetical protein C9374_005206 [Naegleria lovaniensis]
MKISLLSDLHVEHFESFSSFQDKYEEKFHRKLLSTKLIEEGSDVLILAGDVANVKQESFKELLNDVSHRFKHVIYVAGNHEFYGNEYYSCMESMKQVCLEKKNIHFLDQSVVEIKDDETGEMVVFIGCILWSRVPEASKPFVGTSMNDYKVIKIQDNASTEPVNLTVNDTVKWFEEQVQFIEKQIQLAKQENKRAIIVTHNAPLTKGVSDPKYENSTTEFTKHLNTAFATDLRHLMGPPVIAWFFGHTHFSSRQCHNQTIVASNQLGYLLFGNEKNELYDEFWVFDTNHIDYSKYKQVSDHSTENNEHHATSAQTTTTSNKKKCLFM